jgi:hypothetical protein
MRSFGLEGTTPSKLRIPGISFKIEEVIGIVPLYTQEKNHQQD